MSFTRGLAWVGLAVFAYVLFTRLRTLAVLVATRYVLGDAAAVRIRASRIAVETLVVVAVLSLWATSALERGYLDWDVGAGSAHVKLAGVWFLVGALASPLSWPPSCSSRGWQASLARQT